MIKGFPKILLPLVLVFICFFLIFISGILGLDKESEGYFILVLISIVFYILVPLQFLLIVIKIAFRIIKNKKDI